MSYTVSTLREERIRRHIKLREIANAVGLNPTYLSHVEAGRRRPTPAILDAYLQALGLPAAEMPVVPTVASNPIVGRILHLTQKLSPYTLSFFKSVVSGDHSFQSPSVLKRHLDKTPEDIKSFCEHILPHTRGKTRSPMITQGDALIFVWNNLREYSGTIAQLRASTILAHCLCKGADFHHYFVPSAHDQSVDETIWLLRKQIKTILFKSRVIFDAIPQFNYSLYPIDFLLLANKVADLRFAITSSNTKQGMLSHHGVEAPTAYVKKIVTHREQRVGVFRGEGDLEQFLDVYCSTENTSGLRYLSQPLLGSHTRPPDDYAKGTSWWKRYERRSDLFKLHINMERLAANRHGAHNFILKRMESHPVKQICSRNQLEAWAANPNLKSPFSTMEYGEYGERLSRINYILHLLRTFDKFSMAVVDDKEGDQLGWNTGGNGRAIRWLVQGQDRVILETTVENDIESTNADNPNERAYNKARHIEKQTDLQIQIVIKHEAIAQAFQQYFDSVWSKLKKDSVDRLSVIKYFEGLRDRLK